VKPKPGEGDIMGGRAAQVVMGVAIPFLAGVLIRPPEAAFTRPLPRPTGPPVAAGEPTPTPRARRVRARNPEPKPEPVLVVHAIDPDTLADRVPPLEVPGGPGWVQAVVSDDGAILALVASRRAGDLRGGDQLPH
jgi:hypothetical protein